ncbi:hypothetical protein [Nannocystis punicea]|uniref:Secreted protein n=1 Tax=Nannocystis punicea TaxID=2995304 RepID=A0ABY7HB96_9BACT|nr:hypothetical protein [Nannocystis poenicansa]WAS96481.1 hypothetical protein O0S08_10005 [Nannocystis poenicansa]
MYTRATVFSLLLSSPALAAPPSRPTAQELDRMLATIKGAHPDHAPKGKIRPVEDLVKVAEEAGQALEYAPTQALQRLMNYVHAARIVAYERTGDPSHACALLEDADLLLSSRKDAPDPVIKEAYQARGEATQICVPSGPTVISSASVSTPEPGPATREPAAPAQAEPGTSASVMKEPGPQREREDELPLRGGQRKAKAVVGVFAAAGGISALTIGAAVFAAVTKDRLREGVRELQEQGYRLPADDVFLDLSYRHYKLGAGLAIGSGIAAAALFGAGAWLVRRGKAEQPKRVSLTPFGGARQAGLMLSGRF